MEEITNKINDLSIEELQLEYDYLCEFGSNEERLKVFEILLIKSNELEESDLLA